MEPWADRQVGNLLKRESFSSYNEFGEVGIDNQLVVEADVEIFDMNNGCICCTVRDDLIRIIGNLMKRHARFDHLVIETTGLADPAPVNQTFFVDEDLRDELRLDAVVTLVDRKHVEQHRGCTTVPPAPELRPD